jgi:hypothetical protein
MNDLLIREEDDWFIVNDDHPSLTTAERNPSMLLP